MPKMQTLKCAQGHEWERPSQRGKPPKWCPEHKPAVEPSQARPKGAGKESSSGGTETLTCSKCNVEWLRIRARGKKPVLCPECKAQAAKEKAANKPQRDGSNARSDKALDEQWEYISKLQDTFKCRCKLERGMNWQQLRELGYGCTDKRYICPVLVRYRERVGIPKYSVESVVESEDINGGSNESG